MWHSGKESVCQCKDAVLITQLGRSLRVRNGNPLQYSCLKNSMDRGTDGLQSMELQSVRHN